MKKIFFSLLTLLIFSIGVNAQKVTPAKWSWVLSKPNPAVGETVDIIFTLKMDKSWHHYASDFSPNVGPIVSTIKLKNSDSFEAVGGLKSIKSIKKHDDIFDGDVAYFEGKGEMRQSVMILKENPVIEGTYDGQVCSDVTGQCVPVKGAFKLEVKSGATTDAAAKKKTEDELKAEAEKASTTNTESTQQEEKAVPTTAVTENVADSAKESVSVPVAVSDSSATISSTEPTEEKPKEESILTFFLIALGVGLATCLTPCVYPLIPMTVSFFIKQKNGVGKAFIYGASIIGIYVLFGTVIAATLGQAAPNFISTHWFPNLLFFTIFIIFGLSFLGLFEIQLPSNFVNNVDAQSDRGGFIGIFFMAFTLALVSFSCTGPFVGTLLGLGAAGHFTKPIIGMFGFGLGLASPFVLLALSPSLLKKIPKSGGWMNTIKVFFGFLELALALKFFSTVDQTYHWRILDREIFLAIWIATFTLMGLHLLGKFLMPHDDKVEKLSVGRLMVALSVFSFVVYLIPGLFGAPLKALSGLLPPTETQDFVLTRSSGEVAESTNPDFPKTVKYSSFLKLPHGIQGFFDYKDAVAYAQKVNKPIFIDFTGHGCVNCRKMEASVWSDPEVLKRLKNDYVVVALYVDDKTELPKNEWFTSKDDGLEKTTLGDQNLDFEITHFNANAQPYYCLVNPNEDAKPLIAPRAFDQDIKKFIEFLDAGKAKFEGK